MGLGAAAATEAARTSLRSESRGAPRPVPHCVWDVASRKSAQLLGQHRSIDILHNGAHGDTEGDNTISTLVVDSSKSNDVCPGEGQNAALKEIKGTLLAPNTGVYAKLIPKEGCLWAKELPVLLYKQQGQLELGVYRQRGRKAPAHRESPIGYGICFSH